MVGAGTLGALQLLHYFRNCEIKNTGLIQRFWFLRVILTGLLLGILLVRKYMQFEPGRLDYDLFLARWDQIRMYLSPLRIYTIELPSLECVSLYRIFTTWCLIIKHESHNTIYVP